MNIADVLQFDNCFTQELPADPIRENYQRQVMAAFYSRVMPKSVAKPRLLAYSNEMAEMLGLEQAHCESASFVDVFSGNKVLAGMDPHASCYGGHQFGNWSGQLGDGRAINLGEALAADGQRWMLQLKGAGPTPYSRNADGLAVLRSSLREFLCSEAMYHLGVPTTRALSLINSGENVMRDMFYDGNPQAEPGAIVCRAAPSFIRFGNFEIFAARKDVESLQALLDFTIRHYFPDLKGEGAEHYCLWFAEVCRRTAMMIVHWMRVGFVHGVMNTDNMSILGLTIDYGPYGWLENYDLSWTPNTTDAEGRRYCFGQQAAIAQWNLLQLANALLPVVKQAEPLEEALSEYARTFHDEWNSTFANKLGLKNSLKDNDQDFMLTLFKLLQTVETDMTLFYRYLANIDASVDLANIADQDLLAVISDAYYEGQAMSMDYRQAMAKWLREYIQRLQADGLEQGLRRSIMHSVNPLYVFRNYLAQNAVDAAAQGDMSVLKELMQVLKQPYQQQTGMEKYAEKRPEWARHKAGCSMLSCSS